jgi:hypothetical protein
MDTLKRRVAKSPLQALTSFPVLLCALAVAVTILNRQSELAVGPRIELQSTGSRQTTALVFGAGSGVHLVRTSDEPRSVQADLARGPLRVIALRSIQLTATKVPDQATVQLLA